MEDIAQLENEFDRMLDMVGIAAGAAVVVVVDLVISNRTTHPVKRSD